MSVITITKARQSLYNLIKEVNDNAEAVTIVNSRGKNAVVISEEEFENIQETLFFLENPVMVKKMTEALSEPLEECISLDEEEGWIWKDTN